MRKSSTSEMYEILLEKLKKLGIEPISYKAYSKSYTEVKVLIEKLLETIKAPKENILPASFDIVGDWVSCIVHSDGKRLSVWGEELELLVKN